MTDQDRGAYTPPTDEALAFDARRQSERRPLPMTLVGSAVVLVVLIVGVAVVYRGGVRGADEAPRPIGQPVVAVKAAPPPVVIANNVGAVDDVEGRSPAPGAAVATATTQTQGAGVKPLAAVPANAVGPTFAPAPEQPAPRPGPAAKTLALLNQGGQPAAPSRVRISPTAGRPIRTAGGVDGLEVAAAGMTGAAPAPAPSVSAMPPVSTPLPVRTATASPRPKRAVVAASPSPIASGSDGAAAAAGGPVVQIGAFSSAALSEQGYADVSKIMAGQMAGKAKHVMSVDHGGATLFRTWVSGFTSRVQADAFCTALKARRKPCFVKG